MRGQDTKGYFEDESLGKAFDLRLAKRLLSYLKPYIGKSVLAVFLLLLIANAQLATPYLLKSIVDTLENDALADDAKLSLFGIIALVFAGLVVLRFLAEYLSGVLISIVGQNVTYDLRVRVFSHIQKMSLKFFDRNPVGRLITRSTNDIEALNQFISVGVMTTVQDVFMLGGIVLWMTFTSPGLTGIVLAITVPGVLGASIWFRGKARRSYRSSRAILARINSFSNENITGINTVQLFSRQNRNAAKFSQLSGDFQNEWIRAIRYQSIYSPIIENVGYLAAGAVLLFGAWQIAPGAAQHISLGTTVAFFGWVTMLFNPIRDLAMKYDIMQSAMASSERVFKILNRPEEIVNPAEPQPLEGFAGRIEFQNVWFAYDDENWVLKNVSFTVEPGQKIAFVGATGAGKSSVINLICRFYDIQRGRILIDGKDIREIDKYELRRKIGLVLQDVFLFSGSIADNISLGNPEIPREKIRQTAEYVNAAGFIEKLPDGYDSEVQERGATLSVGERQLLSFARALTYDPKILILDEATSNIDTHTEILIQDAVKKLMAERTSIVIAHRLSTIRNVNKIIVMHKGEIHEQGTHEALLRRDGIYRKLHRLQYKTEAGDKDSQE